MIGWIIGAIAVGGVAKTIKNARQKSHYEKECESLANQNFALISSNCRLASENCHLRRENQRLQLTIHNHRRLLADFDKVNAYAKKIGFYGAVDFFYYLMRQDSRLGSWAKFLNKVKHIRNDVAHNGTVYDIDMGFLKKLNECVEICRLHREMGLGGKRAYAI